MTIVETAPAERELPPYFAVSLFKFSVMCICTGGLYQLWWFYKHWCRIRRREQSNIWPAWRAIFAIFWCYACLCRIRSTALLFNVPAKLSAGLLTIAWICHSFLVYLPDPWWLVAVPAFVWLLPAQAVANQINSIAGPDHDKNDSFSGWNITAIVIGSILWVLALIGVFVHPR